jgi:hypothetical protein
MRLPTVTLKHKKSGKLRRMNATDYARDIARWNDWNIVSEQRGDAPDKDVKFDRSQADIEAHRRQDPEREKRFHDKERKQADKAIEVTGETAANLTEQTAEVDTPEPKDWTKMNWPDARKHIHSITGKFPKSKVQAKELMEAPKDA